MKLDASEFTGQVVCKERVLTVTLFSCTMMQCGGLYLYFGSIKLISFPVRNVPVLFFLSGYKQPPGMVFHNEVGQYTCAVAVIALSS